MRLQRLRPSLPPLPSARQHLFGPFPFALPLRNASTTPPKPPLEATTFSERSSPREVHERPERIRGMPPVGARPVWEKERPGVGPIRGGTGSGAEEDFAGPSRPRMYYERPGERDLPVLKSRAPLYILIGIVGLSACGLFLLHATNSERLASSVLRQVTFQLRNSRDVTEALGENVRLADNWWGFGQPWISGTINTMQGRVDLKFRIQGSKAGGTVYFSSIRPQQEGAWRIVRYKLITDSGEVVQLEEKM